MDREEAMSDKRIDPMIADLAMSLAEVYRGKPVERDYVFGDATGGEVFIRMAERAVGDLCRNTTPSLEPSLYRNAHPENMGSIFNGIFGPAYL